MFSNWSRRSISRAIVTPSLVTTGDPVIFSRMTLRPLGPSVELNGFGQLVNTCQQQAAGVFT